MAKNNIDISTGKEIPEASDWLMWVGSIYYPTVDSYIAEANEMGCCKRLGHLPSGLIPGESRVFLAHDDGVNGEGFIFGYFVPSQIQYLADSPDDIPEQIFNRVEWVGNWSDEAERECGDRREGLYCISFTLDEGGEESAGQFKWFAHPRILDAFDEGRKHFRGMLEIGYGDALLKVKRAQTMTPPSRKAHKPVEDLPWTEDDDEALTVDYETYGSKAKVAQLWAYKTGRSKASVLARFIKLADMNG